MKRVSVTNDRGMLRLRWRHQGKIYGLSLGLEDSRASRAIARSKARQIAEDIEYHQFDKTLNKYRPKTIGNRGLTCAELFETFGQHKARHHGVSGRSIETRYRPLARALEKWLDIPAHDLDVAKARDFKSIQLETVTGQTAKARLWLLQSCWDWAIVQELLAPSNPWKGLAAGVKPTPTQQVKPFTAAEIQAILEGFRTHRHYSHYADFVTFLFSCGCRFGEVAALRWEHVGNGFETIWIGESVSRGHHKSTKTGKARTLVLSPSIQNMLGDRHGRLGPQPRDLVFASPRGLPINDHTFSRRAWRSVLESANVPYRKLYATRHSAISHALANGASAIAVAEQSGHDKRVLLDSYAHVIESKLVFKEF